MHKQRKLSKNEKWRHEEDHAFLEPVFGRKHTHTDAQELIGRNGDVYEPYRTTWDGPLVGDKKIAKIEGNCASIAYNSDIGF